MIMLEGGGGGGGMLAELHLRQRENLSGTDYMVNKMKGDNVLLDRVACLRTGKPLATQERGWTLARKL